MRRGEVTDMEIEIRYFEDCPNWRNTRRQIDRLVEDLGIDARITTRLVDTPAKAIELGFQGSPTLIIDGEDPFAHPDAPIGLACRIYQTEEGMAGTPSSSMLEQAILDRAT